MPGNFPRPVNAKWVPQRLSWLYAVFLLLSAVLLIRLVNLSVIQGAYYAQRSASNYLFTRTVDAPRGTIHDRHGVELAFNRPTFAVSVSPGNLTTPTIKASLDHLGELLDADFSEHCQRVANLRPRWRSIRLPRRLTLDQVTPVMEQLYLLPGVSTEQRFQRFYPQHTTLCHVLGHVGKITAPMWTREDRKYQNAGYEKDDEIGISGIEALYEGVLRGQKGLEEVWQSGRGRVIRSRMLHDQATVPGDRLYLTIDLELQHLAETLLLDQKGVILAADPRTGEMLVWASSPGFDLNQPGKIDRPSSQPLINRAIQEHYMPGSTFKIITALAALDAGWDPNRIVTCEHYYRLPYWKPPYKCLGWHGALDLRRALKYSCNVYFYTMANYLYNLDDDAGYRFVETAHRYGFGDVTGVAGELSDMGKPGFREAAGVLPTRRQLRAEPGSILLLAIGQGPIAVTPLQMLMAYVALANEDGELLSPLIVRERRTSDGRIVFKSGKRVRSSVRLPAAHRQVVIEGLRAACCERGGTAYKAGFRPEWDVAGKTSTAEDDRKTHTDAWFIGFAPATRRAELVVLVMIEHGGHGGEVAAPLAVKLFERYFERAGNSRTIAAH